MSYFAFSTGPLIIGTIVFALVSMLIIAGIVLVVIFARKNVQKERQIREKNEEAARQTRERQDLENDVRRMYAEEEIRLQKERLEEIAKRTSLTGSDETDARLPYQKDEYFTGPRPAEYIPVAWIRDTVSHRMMSGNEGSAVWSSLVITFWNLARGAAAASGQVCGLTDESGAAQAISPDDYIPIDWIRDAARQYKTDGIIPSEETFTSLIVTWETDLRRRAEEKN